MFEIIGKYNTATVLQDESMVEKSCIEQINNLVNTEYLKGTNIVIMPDTHTGEAGPIGLTISYDKSKDLKIDPRLVGVDIGCGMSYVKVDLAKLTDLVYCDKAIQKLIPMGFNRHEDILNGYAKVLASLLSKVKMPIKQSDLSVYETSMGTLGGGNHFIEISKCNDDGYLIVHSGSRKFGKDICDYYTKFLTEDKPYLEGDIAKDYINDMNIAQKYAAYNRYAIVSTILSNIDIAPSDVGIIDSIHHNYLDVDNMILRKGAVSAKDGDKVLIPINMADGSILADGCSTEDFNFSAPHGAGRVWGRKETFKKFGYNKKKGRLIKLEDAIPEYSFEDVKKLMEGIQTTTLTSKTLDESPLAYKSIDNILSNLDGIAKNVRILKPILNIKAES